eukprot:gene27231-33532_t
MGALCVAVGWSADTDEEDNHTYEEGKGNREVAMVQTGMVNGEAEYEPVAAADGYPNPNKNHSLAELKARRGYKSPMTGRPVMGQIHVPTGFEDDILCMARHPNKTVFATGEIGRRPKIIVWDATNMQEMAQMAGFHRRAVLSMCFSPGDGNYLASVGKDNDH